MPKIKNVEKGIWDIEGFAVAFHKNGRDVHGAKSGIPAYSYSKAAKNNMTVSDWKKNRFSQSYAGYNVVVYDGDDKEVSGQTTLATVRDTYLDDES